MHSHSPEQAAIAALLAFELHSYDEKLRELLQRRWDPDLYRELSDQFDRMQMHAQSLPRLSSRWTELLISRVELTHALWTPGAPSRINGRVEACHAQHCARLEEVARGCRDYLAPAASPGHDGNPLEEPQRP